jgi:hypothetical protein
LKLIPTPKPFKNKKYNVTSSRVFQNQENYEPKTNFNSQDYNKEVDVLEEIKNRTFKPTAQESVFSLVKENDFKTVSHEDSGIPKTQSKK